MTPAPTSGIPPASTLSSIDRGFANFTPSFIAPGLTHKNFYVQNGLIILAAVVAILLIVLFFLDAPRSFEEASNVAPPTIGK